MRIKSVSIKNLRSIKEAIVHFDGYTCLVGANGAGKSTVLCALNIFFRETENASTNLQSLSIEDFHLRNAEEPIEITVTFTDLSAEAQEDFKSYFRQGQLIVSAVATFNAATGRAEVRQFGQRLGMNEFKDFFRRQADGAKSEELKKIYSDLQIQFPDLPKPGSVAVMAEALNTYEAALPERCELIPSEDQFYGVSKGQNRLQKYLQWVYVPAVKDAVSEQTENKTTALGKLLARTVRSKVNFTDAVAALLAEVKAKYQNILDESQGALDNVSSALQNRLIQWAHPEASLKVTWQQDPARSIKVEEPFAKIVAGEGDFEGEIARFGHGFQRSYLLALLQELASLEDEGSPRLILGCEEPELYQHPPQARHLASILKSLGETNAQVMVSTHSPLFISGENFENVRMIRRDPVAKRSNVKSLSVAAVAQTYAAVSGEPIAQMAASMAKINQCLQPFLNEMFFTQRLVLVEGLEDIAYIHAWLALTDRMSDFRKSGCHLVPTHAKSEMVRPVIIAHGLDIPVFAIFDGDNDKINQAKKRVLHERDNRALLRLLGGDDTQLFPNQVMWGERYAMWPTDLGSVVSAELLNTLGDQTYLQTVNEAHQQFGHEDNLKKNTMLINAKLAIAWDAGGRSASLDTLCDHLLMFGGIGKRDIARAA